MCVSDLSSPGPDTGDHQLHRLIHVSRVVLSSSTHVESLPAIHNVLQRTEMLQEQDFIELFRVFKTLYLFLKVYVKIPLFLWYP